MPAPSLRPGSLRTRVAWAMAGAAGGAALFAAATTSSLAVNLLVEAEDRRLHEAAQDLGYLLDLGRFSVRGAVEYERGETSHSGVGFSVLDAEQRLLAGEELEGTRAALGCHDAPGEMRRCAVRAGRGYWVIAAAPRVGGWSSFAWAVVVSVLGTSILGWWASRKLALVAIRPLERIRTELAALDWESHAHVALNEGDSVLEVDQLRATLARSVARARAAIELAERFAANAAHELRTPLTTIRAEVELLLEKATEETRLDLERVQDEVIALSRLVEKLLILSTPISSVPLDPTGREGSFGSPISLRDVVDDALGLLGPSERERVTACDGDAVVRGDEVLLSALLANALGNALKFGNSARIEVRSRDGRAWLHVLDDGPGVPEGDRARVFEPFVRSSGGPRGQGLGLALIKHVAELHRGRARFIDPPRGHGATLEIQLPLAESPAREMP